MKFLSIYFIFVLKAFFLLPIYAQAQTGKISGKVIDAAKGEPQFGINVILQGTSLGASTDFEGKFTIENVQPGNYTIMVNGYGFNKKIIIDVKVENNKTTKLDIALEEISTEMEEVVITGSYKKESAMSLIYQRKNASSVTDGISADMIKRSPDNTTSEVMKRVPGASIQDNKFAIIRGLNDRYNQGFINGAPLPSTESDRKAFSFDIFPSNMIDNMVIMKTATPDLPADFAGGVIIINTKDIPDENFISISAGGSYNSLTTFKNRLTYNTGKTDWLGFDDGTRALPSNIPSTEEYNKSKTEDKIAYSKAFKNTWQVKNENSTLPNSNFQFALGRHIPVKKNDLGIIFSLSHTNSYKMTPVERRDYLVLQENRQRYLYNDSVHKHEVLMGSMLNLAFKTDKSKFSFKNIYTVNSEDQVSYRTGSFFEDPEFRQNVRNVAMLYSQNSLYSSQLGGEHFLPKNDIRISWLGSYNYINRIVPDFRKQSYMQNVYEDGSVSKFTAMVGNGGPDINQSGRFFSNLNEQLYSANADMSMKLLKKLDSNNIATNFKFGGFTQQRNRDFSARSFGYVKNHGLDYKILEYGLDSIFDPKHFSDKLYIAEDTRPNDSYKASSQLYAAYVMFDNKLGKNLRIVWGARAENFTQKLSSKGLTGQDVTVDTTVLDILPSVNLTYALGKKSNLRMSASQTVSRPEFREIAPFAFYDFNMDAVVAGNPNLQRATIQNYDLRYEIYPGGAQIISASVFYKKFKNAVEMINEPVGGGSRMFGYQNAPEATNYGFEFEFRKSLGFLDTIFHKTYFTNFSLFGNFSYIISEVDLSKFGGASTGKRALQGQSPYIINTGITYTSEKGFGSSLLVNRVGRRIAFVGNADVPSIWENPRTVIDIQFSQKFFDKLDVKLSFNDILAQNQVFYHDLNNNGKYDPDQDNDPAPDNAIYNYTNGRNISVGISYKF